VARGWAQSAPTVSSPDSLPLRHSGEGRDPVPRQPYEGTGFQRSLEWRAKARSEHP